MANSPSDRVVTTFWCHWGVKYPSINPLLGELRTDEEALKVWSRHKKLWCRSFFASKSELLLPPSSSFKVLSFIPEEMQNVVSSIIPARLLHIHKCMLTFPENIWLILKISFMNIWPLEKLLKENNRPENWAQALSSVCCDSILQICLLAFGVSSLVFGHILIIEHMCTSEKGHGAFARRFAVK